MIEQEEKSPKNARVAIIAIHRASVLGGNEEKQIVKYNISSIY